MRFRHKLSIVLVGLAIVPLAATGVLVAALLQHDQVTRIDSRLSVVGASASQAYRAKLLQAVAFARRIANRTDVRLALTKDGSKLVGIPNTPHGMRVVLVRNGKIVFGTPPAGPSWRVTTTPLGTPPLSV